MLYDSEYSEYHFTKKTWPSFDEEEFDNAINFFKNCKRNF
jgi:undecaprenyl pyrophosphate synthase